MQPSLITSALILLYSSGEFSSSVPIILTIEAIDPIANVTGMTGNANPRKPNPTRAPTPTPPSIPVGTSTD